MYFKVTIKFFLIYNLVRVSNSTETKPIVPDALKVDPPWAEAWFVRPSIAVKH